MREQLRALNWSSEAGFEADGSSASIQREVKSGLSATIRAALTIPELNHQGITMTAQIWLTSFASKLSEANPKERRRAWRLAEDGQ